MAVAAEQTGEWRLAQLAFPEADRAADAHFRQFLGGIAVRGEAELELSEQEVNNTTLLSTLQMAALGDEASREVAWTCAATDVGERMFKVANQSKVKLQFQQHNLGQNGRRLSNIHANTLQHTVLIPEMLQRTRSELKNTFVFEALHQQNVLDEYDAVIFSPASTKMSLQEKRDYKFFLDTETCSIQLLSAAGDDATLETAFVAGKKTPESDRHDLETIQRLIQQQGLSLELNDGTETTKYLILIPKGQLKNGVIDVVQLYDEAAGGTFYGEAKPRQDYLEYAAECEARNRNLDQVVNAITNQLISEAHMLETPFEAIMRLDEISERLCVKYSVKNENINELVFGPVSAGWIVQAREAALRGDEVAAERALVKAQNTADSGSCPVYNPNKSNNSDPDNSSSPESSGKKMMHCPFCSARVYDDPCKKVLACWDCGAKVSHGRVTSKGNGGSRARKAREAVEAQLAKQVDEVFAEKDHDETTIAIKALGQAKTLQPA